MITIEDMLEIIETGDHDKQVWEMCKFVYDRQSVSDFDSINVLYAKLPIVHPIVWSIAFLRVGFVTRSAVPAWYAYRDKVIVACDSSTSEQRNAKTTKYLMRGLLND
jgi:hypothetical protein